MTEGINKKYVIQAFELQLKGRFDLLARFYGSYLFEIPAQIMIQQIKDELNISIPEDAIYNLKRRRKKANEAKNVSEEPKINAELRPTFFGE